MDAGAVPRHPWKTPFLRPASVAVHDDGYVPRYPLTVDLLKQSFLDGSLLEVPFEIGSNFPVEDGHG
jgi:hypothetical protein